jgi:hypothetical protein
MSQFVNLELKDLVIWLDSGSHIALPYKRDKRRTDYLMIESEGPQRAFCSNDHFERQFKRGPADSDPRSYIPKLTKALKRAYLPGEGVAEILLEVLRMATVNGKTLEDCSAKELAEHFNAINASVGGTGIITEKTFKTKKLLLDAVKLAEANLKARTPEQVVNKEANTATAEKRLAGLADLKERKAEDAELRRKTKAEKAISKEAAMVNKKVEKKVAPSKKAEKKVAPSKKAAPTSKKAEGIVGRKSQGIGAFCCELVLKGKSNEDVATAAQAKFGSKTSASSVAWYRNKLKSEGLIG